MMLHLHTNSVGYNKNRLSDIRAHSRRPSEASIRPYTFGYSATVYIPSVGANRRFAWSSTMSPNISIIRFCLFDAYYSVQVGLHHAHQYITV